MSRMTRALLLDTPDDRAAWREFAVEGAKLIGIVAAVTAAKVLVVVLIAMTFMR